MFGASVFLDSIGFRLTFLCGREGREEGKTVERKGDKSKEFTFTPKQFGHTSHISRYCLLYIQYFVLFVGVSGETQF